jgi:predicted nucleic acid-binding protein
MIFVDSSVWVDYLRAIETPQTAKLDAILGVEHIVVGDLVYAEVLQGCRDPRSFEETLRLLRLADFIIVGGRDVAVEAARNFIKLRSLGVTVRKTIDTLIATRCLINGLKLLHNDRDFIPFETYLGLKSAIPSIS